MSASTTGGAAGATALAHEAQTDVRSGSGRTPLPRAFASPVLGILAIVILGGLLQFWALDAKSLWDDEVRAIEISGQATWDRFVTEFQRSERQPPLHYLFLYGWIKVFGFDETLMRMPSAAFATASVGAMAWLGWRVGGPRLALIGAYLLAISPMLLLYGRMVRYYSLAILLAIVSSAALAEALREEAKHERSWPWWLLYAVTCLGMLFTSYVSAGIWAAQIVFAACVLFAFWRSREIAPAEDGSAKRPVHALRAWLISQAGIGVALGAWLVFQWLHMLSFRWSPPPEATPGAHSLLLKIIYPQYAFALGETILPWNPFAIIGLVAFAILLPVGIWQCRRLGPWGVFPVAGWIGAVAAGVFAFEVITRDLAFNSLPARAIWGMPFLLLTAAVGISALKPKLAVAATIAISAAYVAGIANYFNGQQFIDAVYTVPYRELLQQIRDESRPGDLILTEREWTVRYYHSVLFSSGNRPTLIPTASQAETRAAVESGRYERIWLITFGGWSRLYTAPDLVETISRQYRLAESRAYVPQDPWYIELRRRAQGVEEPAHRVVVQRFDR